MGKHLAHLKLLSVEMNHANHAKVIAPDIEHHVRRHVVSGVEQCDDENDGKILRSPIGLRLITGVPR